MKRYDETLTWDYRDYTISSIYIAPSKVKKDSVSVLLSSVKDDFGCNLSESYYRTFASKDGEVYAVVTGVTREMSMINLYCLLAKIDAAKDYKKLS